MVLIARANILEQADADQRLLEAAEHYAESEASQLGRLIRALRPDGDGSTSVGDALRRAAAGRGVEAEGQARGAGEAGGGDWRGSAVVGGGQRLRPTRRGSRCCPNCGGARLSVPYTSQLVGPFSALEGLEVEQVWVWWSLRLVFDLGPPGRPDIYVDVTKFTFTDVDGRQSEVNIETDPRAAGPVLGLLHHRVTQVQVRDWELGISFDTGARLVCAPHPQYEATPDLGKPDEPVSFVAAAVAAVLRARHAVTDMASFAARERSAAATCVGDAAAVEESGPERWW